MHNFPGGKEFIMGSQVDTLGRYPKLRLLISNYTILKCTDESDKYFWQDPYVQSGTHQAYLPQ